MSNAIGYAHPTSTAITEAVISAGVNVGVFVVPVPVPIVVMLSQNTGQAMPAAIASGILMAA